MRLLQYNVFIGNDVLPTVRKNRKPQLYADDVYIFFGIDHQLFLLARKLYRTFKKVFKFIIKVKKPY